MKKIRWVLQPGLQVLFYVALYEVCINFLKKKSLIKVDVAIGLSLKYMFFLFATMSVIFAVMLYFKKEKNFIDCLFFIACYGILFLILFGVSTNLFIIVLVIAILSVIISFLTFQLMTTYKLGATPGAGMFGKRKAVRRWN
jgi:hypothetical protein